MSKDTVPVAKIIACVRPADLVQIIEQHGPRMCPGLGATTLHAFVVLLGGLSEEEQRTLFATPVVKSLLLQLGSQLSGAAEIDAQGLTSILWALAKLKQTESPLLGGLIKRLMLLTSHGCVSTALFLVIVQAIASLNMLGGPVGAAVLQHTQAQLMAFTLGELATLCRALAEATGTAAAPLLRDFLEKRGGDLTTAQEGKQASRWLPTLDPPRRAGAGHARAASAVVFLRACVIPSRSLHEELLPFRPLLAPAFPTTRPHLHSN